MKKYLIPLIAIVCVAVLSYMYSPVSFLLLAVIFLNLLILLVAGVVRMFRGSLGSRWFRVPLLIIGVCVSGVLIVLFQPLEQAIVHSGNVSKKLAHAYKTDQADRMTMRAYLGILENNLVKRDSIRLEQVSKLCQDNQNSLPMDKFHAAFVFHHGKNSSLFKIAHKLANEAASASELQNNYMVQWLAKATYDRWMVSLGKPHKYGTQDKFSVSIE